MNLIQLLNNFHTKGGKYQITPLVSYGEVAKAVKQWFIDNGATFFWDSENDQGYMLFNSKLFLLNKNDVALREYLLNIGNIVSTTAEGSAILEALCNCKLSSQPIKVRCWLSNIERDNGEVEIHISQSNGQIIKIVPGDVIVSNSSEYIYHIFAQSDFQPFEYMPNIDIEQSLRLLWNNCVNFFVVPKEGKEIIICWLLSIFLKDLSAIEPGMRIYGQASSGKSTILKLIYWLFYGDNSSTLPTFSLAGAWRRASIEPLLLIDNENVKDLNNDWQKFFDLCSTGGKRILGEPNSYLSTKTQSALVPVIVSGLDTILLSDVRTRYYEIEAHEKYQSNYYESIDRKKLLASRPTILSGIYKLFSQYILPNIKNFQDRRMIYNLKKKLGSKHRTVDYFVLMLSVANAIGSICPDLIDCNNIESRWCDFIVKKAEYTDINNSITVEWVNTFRSIFLQNENNFEVIRITKDGGKIVRSFNSPSISIKLLSNFSGIEGSREDIMNIFRWIARVVGQSLPWKSVRDFERDIKDEVNAWKAMGYKYIETKKGVRILWNGDEYDEQKV